VASDVGSLLTVVNWRMNATKVTLHLDNSTGWLRPFTHVSLGSSGEPLSWSVGSDAHTVAIAPFRLEVSCHDIAGIRGAYSESASKSLRTGGRRGSPALREPDAFAESCAWGGFSVLCKGRCVSSCILCHQHHSHSSHHRLPPRPAETTVTAMQCGSATTDSPADSRPEAWSTWKHVRPPSPLPFVPSFTPPSGPFHSACLRTNPHQPTKQGTIRQLAFSLVLDKEEVALAVGESHCLPPIL